MAAVEGGSVSHSSRPTSVVDGAAAPRRGGINENTPITTLALEVLKGSVPLGLAAVAQMSISVVMVAMVGKMVGDSALGATTLATGLLNATAFTFAAGFCGALETVLSHSYGRDPTSKLYGVYAQRMALMLLIIAAFVGPLLAFADSFLIAIGQNPHTAQLTGKFCRIALFGVYSVMLLEMMRRYFACQHLNAQLSVNLIAGAVSFPFVLWVCIKMLGFAGAAVGWVILMTSMSASLFVYLMATGKYKKTWGGWETTALMNWGPLLGLAFPSMAMMMSEWMSLEINLIVAGYASTNELAAFSIVYQCSSLLWSMASGVFIEAAVLVGNALGQGKPMFARRCALLCVALSMGAALVNIAATLLLQYRIPTFFSDNSEVQALYRKLLHFFVVYHFFDCVQSCMMGVLRGCGLQTVGAVCIALVYSVVGVPFGAILFFKTSIGVEALWMGPCFGVSVVGFPLYCYLLQYYIPWSQLQPREEDIPSLNTSMDERSMRAYTNTPPPSTPASDDEFSPNSFIESDSMRSEGSISRRQRSSRHGSPALGPVLDPDHHLSGSVNLTGGNGASCENASFTSISNFYIPQRSILTTPQYLSNVQNLSEAPAAPPRQAEAETLQPSGAAAVTAAAAGAVAASSAVATGTSPSRRSSTAASSSSSSTRRARQVAKDTESEESRSHHDSAPPSAESSTATSPQDSGSHRRSLPSASSTGQDGSTPLGSARTNRPSFSS